MTTTEMRELDQWIAEHVMGWRQCKSPMNAEFPCFIAWSSCVIYHENALVAREFRPTFNPAAAMEVLEKCIQKSEWVIEMTGSEADKHWLVFSGEEKKHDRASASAETLPLAICLFAKELFK